jgi:hypothetical protein
MENRGHDALIYVMRLKDFDFTRGCLALVPNTSLSGLRDAGELDMHYSSSRPAAIDRQRPQLGPARLSFIIEAADHYRRACHRSGRG